LADYDEYSKAHEEDEGVDKENRVHMTIKYPNGTIYEGETLNMKQDG